MKTRILALAIAALGVGTALGAGPAFAALETGAAAPDFTADGALAGQPFKFRLSEALRNGPVVLYFFPAAFTPGCTLETQMFADKAEAFKEAGATLIGVTRGNVDRLAEFSREHCRDKFPVAAVTKETVEAYNVVLPARPDWSDRTSYVISKDGRISFVHSAMKPDEHVSKTLEAVKKLTGR